MRRKQVIKLLFSPLGTPTLVRRIAWAFIVERRRQLAAYLFHKRTYRYLSGEVGSGVGVLLHTALTRKMFDVGRSFKVEVTTSNHRLRARGKASGYFLLRIMHLSRVHLISVTAIR